MTPKAKRDTSVYLADVQQAIQQIETYTVDGKEAFLADEKTQDAVIRRISIIGEAAGRIPKSLTSQYAAVPWKEVIGMRSILVHDYMDTNIERVWQTVVKELSPLKRTVDRMLKDLTSAA